MRKWLIFIACVLVLSACASQPVPVDSDAAGFFTGLLHGLIAPITLVIHIFVDSVRMYQFPNNGGWYDFGFWLGVAWCCRER